MKIIDKYIIIEMLGPFLFGVLTFTILFFVGGQLSVVTRMVADGGAPLEMAILYSVKCLPAIIVLTCPMAVLLAALLSFGRLSGESELVAMKAGGISFLRISFPAITLSLLLAILALYLNNFIAPESTYSAHNIAIDYLFKSNESFLENMIVRDKLEDGTESVIFFRKLFPKENRMESVTVQFFRDGKRTREMFADHAFYKTDIEKWFLKKAYITSYDDKQKLKIVSSSEEVYMPLNKSPELLADERQRSPEEMDMKTLERELAIMEKKGFEVEAELKTFYRYEVAYHQKTAIPFTCFVFGLFGIPLGIRHHRTSRAMGLGLSIIFIFIYYFLMSIGMTLGHNGRIEPFWAAWFPNIVFAVAGIALIIKRARE